MTRADLTTATVADLFPDADGQRFAVLLDQGRVGLVDTDLTGRLVRVNAAFAAMLGRTPAQLLGLWLPDQLLHPGDRTPRGDLLAPLLSGQVTVVDTSRSYTHADGSAIHTRITIAVLRDPDGRPAQLTTAVVDVTRQVQAKHDLEVSTTSRSSTLRCSRRRPAPGPSWTTPRTHSSGLPPTAPCRTGTPPRSACWAGPHRRRSAATSPS